MIKTVADLLKAFADQERTKLDKYDMNHGPTIGAMYEGLTKEIVSRSLPVELGLQVVSGFAFFKEQLSGEIDCMLVRGEGEQVPYTGKYKWHIKDVIAVFEVKKTLSAEDLADSYNHLRVVSQLYAQYVESGEAKGLRVDISWPRRVFGQITGVAPPEHGKVEELPFDLEMIYHTIISEFLGPVRIVVAYHGWAKEKTLREHIFKMLEGRLATPAGLGVGSFPQLIIGGEYSLVKANGLPYTPPLLNGMWPFLFSTSHNPLRVLLELVFSKIDFQYGTNLAQDDSVEQEAMSPCIRAKAVQKEERSGWEYLYDDLSTQTLKQRGAIYQWEPAEITNAQHAVFARLCNGQAISLKDSQFIEFASKEEGGFGSFVRSLVQTQLIAIMNDELVLTTEQCQVIFFGGKCYAGENNAGQMMAWLKHKTGKRLDVQKMFVLAGVDDTDDRED